MPRTSRPLQDNSHITGLGQWGVCRSGVSAHAAGLKGACSRGQFRSSLCPEALIPPHSTPRAAVDAAVAGTGYWGSATWKAKSARTVAGPALGVLSAGVL